MYSVPTVFPFQNVFAKCLLPENQGKKETEVEDQRRKMRQRGTSKKNTQYVQYLNSYTMIPQSKVKN